jgi:hypothetical protein
MKYTSIPSARAQQRQSSCGRKYEEDEEDEDEEDEDEETK